MAPETRKLPCPALDRNAPRRGVQVSHSTPSPAVASARSTTISIAVATGRGVGGRTVRGVATMADERVAVRIVEEAHVTDAGVDRLAQEPHTAGLEVRARSVHVRDL